MNDVSSHSDEWVPLPLGIPPYWEQVDFEDVFENIPISHLKIPQNEYYPSGAIPIVDQGVNLIGGFTNDESKSIQPHRGLVVFGDHTKRFKLIRFRFAPGADGIKVLKPITIDERFAYYACRALRLPDRGYSRHYSFLRKSKLPFAPLGEQHRVVDKIEELFSELDKGVDSLKTAREQLKAYRQAVLKHAFEGKLTEQWREENKHKLETPEQLLVRINKERDRRYQQQLEEWNIAVSSWELQGKRGKKPRRPTIPKQLKVITSKEIEALPEIPSAWRFVRLSEIAEIGSGMSVNLSRKINEPVKVAYLRVVNVQRGFIDLSEVKYMTIEKSQMDRLTLKHWDILFNEGGDRDKLGRGWIWQSKVTPCITQNHVFRASPYLPSKEQSTLISHWGNTFGQRYFEEMGKQTTNLASINKTVLSDFPVPLISFEEQEELCKQLDRMMMFIDVQIDEISMGLEKARTLRQAILLAAFSGGLTQQDPNDEPASILLERIRTEKAMQKGTHKKNNRRKTGTTIA